MDLAIDQASRRSRRSLTANLTGVGLNPVSNVLAGADLLASRRVGRIVTENGRLEAIYGRWWPHAGNMLQVLWDNTFRTYGQDRCELHYHQTFAAPEFITLSYVRSGPRTSIATCYAATLVLDEIARIKKANAIVCHVTNDRMTDRLLRRWGWQQHCSHWRGRHYIKRFYGEYPPIDSHWLERM